MVRTYWDASFDEYSQREDVLLIGETMWPKLMALPKTARILDAGCGDGYLVQQLRKAGYTDTWGLTYQPMEITQSLTRGLPEGAIVLGDLLEIPWPDEHFDAVICWDVLEHTVAPYVVLQEMARVTRMQGELHLFIPGQSWQDCSYHLIVPTQRQMYHLLGQSAWQGLLMVDMSVIDPEMAYFHAKRTVRQLIPCKAAHIAKDAYNIISVREAQPGDANVFVAHPTKPRPFFGPVEKGATIG